LLALLLAPCTPSRRAAAEPGTTVRGFDFHAYLTEGEPECAVGLDSVDYADLDGDGREEALVVASTCYTGTAGPDVHKVVRLDDAGRPVELEIDDRARTFHGKPIYDHLVGNRNFDLDHDGQLLVERFQDCSERHYPLTLYLRWNGQKFVLVDVHQLPFFRTSFDCARARTDAENTVCANEDLADADRELAAAYAGLVSRLPPEEKGRLREEQRQWMRMRDGCTYKWVHDCLSALYRERLATLKDRSSQR
jgi:uncharacterized protein YecT (DUF1311 family)